MSINIHTPANLSTLPSSSYGIFQEEEKQQHRGYGMPRVRTGSSSKEAERTHRDNLASSTTANSSTTSTSSTASTASSSRTPTQISSTSSYSDVDLQSGGWEYEPFCPQSDEPGMPNRGNSQALVSQALMVSPPVANWHGRAGGITTSSGPAYAARKLNPAERKRLTEKQRAELKNNQALIAATKAGSIRKVTELIRLNVDVNRPDAEGHTALHYAAELGNFFLVMTLIEQDADKQTITREGYTAIMLAAKQRHMDVVEVLASYDKQPAQRSNHSVFQSAARFMDQKEEKVLVDELQHAVTNDDVPMAARVIATGKASVEEQDQRGHTLLVLAAGRGNVEMIMLLLCAGASVHAGDDRGRTPLMHAAAQRQFLAIAALLRKGAVASRLDNQDRSALSEAIEKDDTRVLEALLAGKTGGREAASNASLIALAASLGKRNTVKLLLEQQADRPDANGSLALAVMAKTGKLAAVKTLLAAGADPHHRAWDGHTAFTLAAANGHEDIVNALIAHCPSPHKNDAWIQRLQNETDSQGRTALMFAILNRKPAMVEALLKKQADPHKVDHKGRNAILWAAARGDQAIFSLLLGYHATHIATDTEGNTVILAAAANGNAEIVELLCRPFYKNSIFDINTPNRNGDTPLIVAARHGDLKVVQLLLENGATVLHHNHDGRSALLEAAAHGRRAIMTVLQQEEAALPTVYPVMNAIFKAIVEAVPAAGFIMQRQAQRTREFDKAGNSMMHLLASNGHRPLLELMLSTTAAQSAEPDEASAESDSEGFVLVASSQKAIALRPVTVDIDITNEEGLTPLCIAARNGHYSTVEMLIERGALVDHASREGVTPLWLACRLKKCTPEREAGSPTGTVHMSPEFMVDLMLRYGALPDEASFLGQTPLIAASATGNASSVSQLIDAGARVNYADVNGLTPLMHAAHFGHSTVAIMLLEAGAAPDFQPQALSALIFAAEGGHDKLVRLLIERGAQKNQTDAFGATALIGASSAGNLSTVKLLIGLGVDLLARDNRGRDALYYAKEGGHFAIAQALQEGYPPPRDF